MTGQTILDLMKLSHRELEVSSGGDDVTRGLLAANAAQDYLEAVLAGFPGALGDSTGTVTTSASTETTTFPAGLLRVDRLQFIDPVTNRPAYDLVPSKHTGGLTSARWWPFLGTSTTSGKPVAYWTNGRSIYWKPLPDGTHTIRWHGLQSQADITAVGTFSYPDIFALPVANFATKVILIGLGDAAGDIDVLAMQMFGPAIKAISNFNRDGGNALSYTEYHDT